MDKLIYRFKSVENKPDHNWY